jgi:PAS domain S-box-containing protein
MRLTLERQIPLVFAIALILLIVIIYFAFRSMNSLGDALRLQKHTHAVLSQLDETLILAVDAETSARGFLITADETLLEPYNQARQKIDGSLAQLRGLTVDNTQQKERANRLEKLIGERLDILRTATEQRRSMSLAQVEQSLILTRGRELMSEIRRLIGEMKKEEENLLASRQNELDNTVKNTYRMIFLAGIAGVLSLALANYAVFREIGKRSRAELELKESNKELERRVEERTQELSKTNSDLKTEMEKREQSEIVLRESEEFNRSIFENSPDCVHILDLEGKIQAINSHGLELMEIEKAEDYIGKQWVDFWENDYAEAAYQTLQTAVKGKKAGLEGFRRTAKGTVKYWHASVAPIFDIEGKPIRIISTSRDITERREAEAERERLLKNEQSARKDAEIANRLRDEFLATVSHELRAPLNSILGWARLLEKGNLDETTSEKAIQTIVRNADAQNRLIEDLLDVSRIISGKLRLEVMTVKPINVVESALETVRPAAEAKGIKIEVKGEKDISHISGDPNRLQQVIWNLLSNAIKFTPPEGEVRLEIEREEDFVEIRVKDTGVGIKEEFLPHVFDRFSQADASSIRKFGGLGLGLAIVRHITEMHGGTVRAESAGENRGSTFIVRLPLVVQTREEDEAIELRNQAQSLENDTKLSLDGMLILVVDDEEDTRQLLVQSLTFYGATVITAESAAQAFDALQEKNPDVLVSDIGMPDEDGYSLIRRIRALTNKKHRDISAIALTAFTRAQDRMKALTSGYQNHVAKPVEPDELATVIASLTGRLQINEPEE